MMLFFQPEPAYGQYEPPQNQYQPAPAQPAAVPVNPSTGQPVSNFMQGNYINGEGDYRGIFYSKYYGGGLG